MNSQESNKINGNLMSGLYQQMYGQQDFNQQYNPHVMLQQNTQYQINGNLLGQRELIQDQNKHFLLQQIIQQRLNRQSITQHTQYQLNLFNQLQIMNLQQIIQIVLDQCHREMNILLHMLSMISKQNNQQNNQFFSEILIMIYEKCQEEISNLYQMINTLQLLILYFTMNSQFQNINNDKMFVFYDLIRYHNLLNQYDQQNVVMDTKKEGEMNQDEISFVKSFMNDENNIFAQIYNILDDHVFKPLLHNIDDFEEEFQSIIKLSKYLNPVRWLINYLFSK